MDKDQLTRMFREQIIPEPHSFELQGDDLFSLTNGCAIRINGPKDAQAEAVRLLAKYWGMNAGIRRSRVSLSSRTALSARAI